MYVLYSYVCALAVFADESKITDLTLAVPILVFEITAVFAVLMSELATQ